MSRFEFANFLINNRVDSILVDSGESMVQFDLVDCEIISQGCLAIVKLKRKGGESK